MHAAVVQVDLSGADEAAAVKNLEEQIVPTVKASPGFQRGVWVRHEDGTKGIGVTLYDTEENARAVIAMIQSGGGAAPPEGVTMISAEVYEVMAEA